jgi:hypothetical protein
VATKGTATEVTVTPGTTAPVGKNTPDGIEMGIADGTPARANQERSGSLGLLGLLCLVLKVNPQPHCKATLED